MAPWPSGFLPRFAALTRLRTRAQAAAAAAIAAAAAAIAAVATAVIAVATFATSAEYTHEEPDLTAHLLSTPLPLPPSPLPPSRPRPLHGRASPQGGCRTAPKGRKDHHRVAQMFAACHPCPGPGDVDSLVTGTPGVHVSSILLLSNKNKYSLCEKLL